MDWSNCYSLNVSCPICSNNGGERRNNTRCSIAEDGSLATCYYVHTDKAIKRGSSPLGEYSIYRLKEINEDLSQYIEKKEKVKVFQTNIASLIKRDTIYNELLEIGNISSKHKIYLSDNGLSDPDYISIQHRERYKLPNLIMNRLSINALDGVPGFGMKGDKWFLSGSSGIAMPCITLDETCTPRKAGFQVRSDDEEQGNLRYTWLSSKKYELGSSISKDVPINKIHLAIPNSPVISYFLITEGIKKADIACSILNQPVIGLTGIASQDGLLLMLERMSQYFCVDRNIPIRIAVDRDIEVNSRVKIAFDNMVKTLKKAQYPRVQQVLWDDRYKGIDDFLLMNQKNQLIGRVI